MLNRQGCHDSGEPITVVPELKRYERNSETTDTLSETLSVAKCRGSWVVGSGSWVWVNVVGKKSLEKNDKVKYSMWSLVRASPRYVE